MNRRIFFEKSVLGISSILFFPQQIIADSKDRPKVKWGIATITWSDSYLKGLEEIGQLGVKGIQIRGNAFKEFKDKPKELKIICKNLNLEIPILSGGDVNPDPKMWNEQKSKFEEMASFVKAIGGRYIQATTFKRDSYPPGKEKLSSLASTLNQLGEVVKNQGVELLLHNHMHQLCQTPEEVSHILNETDPKKVGFLLDIAHYSQAGGNPSEAILKYKKRIKLLHVKDLIAPKQNYSGPSIYNYQFVELGKGNKINMPEVLASLKTIGFRGWCIIELDSVPNLTISPLEATKTSLKYLETNFGYKFH
jgi:inosose dehydratase